MEAIFQKGTSLKSWKPRYWKLRGYELLQGVKTMKSFSEFSDEKNIKYHYNLLMMKYIGIDKNKAHIIIIQFTDNHQLSLRFKNDSICITWLKLLCSYSVNLEINNYQRDSL